MGQRTARDETMVDSIIFTNHCFDTPIVHFITMLYSYVRSCSVLDHSNISPISGPLVGCINIYIMLWTPHAPTGYRRSPSYPWWPTPNALQVGALRGSVVQDLNTLPGASDSHEGFMEDRLWSPVESKVQDLASAVNINISIKGHYGQHFCRQFMQILYCG